jgi:hypothetical protein
MEDAVLSPTEKSAQVRNIKTLIIYFTFEELCIRSLFHLVRLSMGIFTANFLMENEAQTC